MKMTAFSDSDTQGVIEKNLVGWGGYLPSSWSCYLKVLSLHLVHVQTDFNLN